MYLKFDARVSKAVQVLVPQRSGMMGSLLWR
jgi:hypothetical protein